MRGARFTNGQIHRLEMIRDQIAEYFGIEPDDLPEVLVSRDAWMPEATDPNYAPFVVQGGLCRVHQLFGDGLAPIMETAEQRAGGLDDDGCRL